MKYSKFHEVSKAMTHLGEWRGERGSDANMKKVFDEVVVCVVNTRQG